MSTGTTQSGLPTAQTSAAASSTAVSDQPLVVNLSEDAWMGDAQYIILVDGTQVGGTRTATASHGKGQTQAVALGSFAAGHHTVSVKFLNDAYGGTSATDRNLYVDSLSFGGVISSGATLYANGTANFNVVAPVAVPPTVPVAPPAPLDTIVLQLSSIAGLGSVNYRVSVNGVVIGGDRTLAGSSSGAAQHTEAVTLTGNFGAKPSIALTLSQTPVAGPAGSAVTPSLVLNGITYDGSGYSGVTLGPGVTQSSSNAPAGGATPDTLIVSLSEDTTTADAQFTVSIDGQQLGGVYTTAAQHGAGNTESFSFAGNWGSGPHTVALSYVNPPAKGVVRNLYADHVAYDGQDAGSANFSSSNLQTFSVGAPASSAPVTTPGTGTGNGSGPDTVTLKISEDAWQGDAQYTVSVNGQQIGGTRTATAIHGKQQDETVVLHGTFGGTPTVVVNFLNDAYGGSASADRNLYVDGGTAGSLAVASVALPANGPVTVAQPQNNGTGPDTVTLQISEDAYQGDAQYTVSVNGTQIGGTRTTTASHALHQDDTLTLHGTFGAAPTVAVTFLNDDYNGSASADRNLYVDGGSAGAAPIYGTAILANGKVTVAGAAAAPPPASQSQSAAPVVTGTIVHAPTIPQPSQAGDIVGFNLQNPGTTPLAARTITFAEEFSDGQVPAGSHLVAIINGQRVAVQLDVKATNADGSVRMADVTLQQPALAAGQTTGAMLALDTQPAPAQPSVDLSKLSNYNVTVDLGIHNADGTVTPVHIDAGAALRAALANGTATYWLKGPQATEARVDVPVSGSLHVTFDIRGYADGTTQTNIGFDNDYALQAKGGDVTYDVSVKQSGASVVQKTALTEYQYQTWNQEVYSNGAPGVNVQHDIAALERTGAIQNYDLTTGVSSTTIASNAAEIGTSGWGILGNDALDQYMGTTGERPDIGPNTDPNSIWLVTQNAQAATYASTQDQAAGSVPWHLYNPATGTYVNTSSNPTLWADGRGGSSYGTTGLTQPITTNSGWQLDNAHEPNLSYVPYLLDGEHYTLDQLNAQATETVLATWPDPRQAGLGLVANGYDQVRQQAWALQQVDNAAWINPDSSPLKSYFQQVENNNFAFLLNETQTANEGQAYGYLKDYNSTGQIAPWEEDFIGMIVGQAAQQGNTAASSVLAWETNFLAGRFTSAAQGFDPNDGDSYRLNTYDANGVPYQTWAAIDANSGHTGTPFGTYMQSARASVAEAITNNQSPQAIQAFGWISKNYTGANTASFQLSPKYDVAPRLSDGNLLTQDNIHISNDTIASTLSYGNADQLVYAGAGNDTVVGGTGINILFGGSGTDTLLGGPNTDYLFGGTGATKLYGGAGSNWLQSGSGAAVFQVDEQDTAKDIISGFRVGTDSIALYNGHSAHLAPSSGTALVAGATQDASGNAVLHLSASHDVTLLGISKAQVSTSLFS